MFWKRSKQRWPGFGALNLDVWVCILPMLPIHFGYIPVVAFRDDRGEQTT